MADDFKVSMTMEGGRELFAALGELSPAVEKKVERHSLREAGKMVADRAKQLCPVYVPPPVEFASSLTLAAKNTKAIPGLLRDNIKIIPPKKRRKNFVSILVGTVEGWFKGKTFYGAFLEFGTSRMKARPFVRPAFDSQIEALLNKIITGISDGLSKVWLSKTRKAE